MNGAGAVLRYMEPRDVWPRLARKALASVDADLWREANTVIQREVANAVLEELEHWRKQVRQWELSDAQDKTVEVIGDQTVNALLIVVERRGGKTERLHDREVAVALTAGLGDAGAMRPAVEIIHRPRVMDTVAG